VSSTTPDRERAPGTSPTRPRLVAYPVNRLFAVLDDAVRAEQAAAALLEAGFGVADVARLEGPAAAAQFDGTGAAHGRLSRLGRLVQFSLMDQLPDLAWYEAALREGRIVLSVRAPDRAIALRAVAALESAGGHFINRFGRFQTEEFVRWRGPEPEVSDLLRR
jgi:hypothetical protein